jgi:hypothetical protein
MIINYSKFVSEIRIVPNRLRLESAKKASFTNFGKNIYTKMFAIIKRTRQYKTIISIYIKNRAYNM